MTASLRLAICIPLVPIAACGGALLPVDSDGPGGSLADLAASGPPPALAFAPPEHYAALHPDEGPICISSYFGRANHPAGPAVVAVSVVGGEAGIYHANSDGTLGATTRLATGVTRAVSVLSGAGLLGLPELLVADGDRPQIALLQIGEPPRAWPLARPAMGAMALGDFDESAYVDVAATTDQLEIIHEHKSIFMGALATGLPAVEQLGALPSDFPAGGASVVTFSASGTQVWQESGLGPAASLVQRYSFAGTGRNPARGYGVGRFDGDYRSDLVLAPDGVLTVLLSDGAGSFRRAAGGGHVGGGEFQIADFNGDRKLDVAARSGGESGVEVHLGDGTGGFFAPVVFRFDSAPGSTIVHLAAGDLDGDGRADLAATLDGASRRIAVLRSRTP